MATTTCPRCGAPSNEGQQFCAQCGQPLSMARAAGAPPPPAPAGQYPGYPAGAPAAPPAAPPSSPPKSPPASSPPPPKGK